MYRPNARKLGAYKTNDEAFLAPKFHGVIFDSLVNILQGLLQFTLQGQLAGAGVFALWVFEHNQHHTLAAISLAASTPGCWQNFTLNPLQKTPRLRHS